MIRFELKYDWRSDMGQRPKTLLVRAYSYSVSKCLRWKYSREYCQLCGAAAPYRMHSELEPTINICGKCIEPFRARWDFDPLLYQWLQTKLINDVATYIMREVVV